MSKLPKVEASENHISSTWVYHCGNTWTDGIATFRLQGHPFITPVLLWTGIF